MQQALKAGSGFTKLPGGLERSDIKNPRISAGI
jgi:hypothetical protein